MFELRMDSPSEQERSKRQNRAKTWQCPVRTDVLFVARMHVGLVSVQGLVFEYR